MKQPKISVIVPVYKVESYLRKCLDSIVNQTYTNLEIILVDDGSPDNCGAICDEYAAEDDRITVIHQTNSGLSAARNAALNIATGDYIGFVDSDDWIELDMYEYLVTNALSENADIAVCGRLNEFPNRTVVEGWPKYELLGKESALIALLEDRVIHNCVWDKIWKRKLFQGVSFPVGRNFEDIAIAYRMFESADRVICLPKHKYHYLQRSDSIMSDRSLKNMLDWYIAAKERYDDMICRWPQLHSLIEHKCLLTAISVWSGYFSTPKAERQEYLPMLQDIALFAKLRYKEAATCLNFGMAGRMVMRLVPYAKVWSFALSGLVGWLYKLKNGHYL